MSKVILVAISCDDSTWQHIEHKQKHESFNERGKQPEFGSYQATDVK